MRFGAKIGPMSTQATINEEAQSIGLKTARDFLTEAEIAEVRAVSNWRGAWLIFHCWAVVILTWVVVCMWTNPLTIFVGILIVGARQLGFFILSHDGAHYTLFTNKQVNDWACEWLISRPQLGSSIYGYRKYHMKHHRYTQQSEDPDLPLSAPFPISGHSFRRKMWRDLSGQTGWKQYGGNIKDMFREGWWSGLVRVWPNVLINLMFFAGFALSGHWYLFFLLWWVPALTWNRFITRIRNIGEHAAVPDNDDRLRNTRTVLTNWLERVFIAPYYVNYHLEHHLVVSSPCYNLKRVHQLLLSKGYGDKMEIQPNYPTMLRHALAG